MNIAKKNDTVCGSWQFKLLISLNLTLGMTIAFKLGKHIYYRIGINISDIAEVIVETKIRLYTSGRKEELKAFDRLLKFVNRRLVNQYVFEILDVFENPSAAEKDSIVVTPTIICRVSQEPPRKVIGNIDDPERIIGLLGLL